MFGVWVLISLFIVVGVLLLVVTVSAQAKEFRLTPEQEVAYRHSLDKEDIKAIRHYIDLCIAYTDLEPKRNNEKVVIGMPCEPHDSSRVGASIQEQGIDKVRGKFLVIEGTPLKEDNPKTSAEEIISLVNAEIITIMFNTPPYAFFNVVIAFLGTSGDEPSNPVLWGFDEEVLEPAEHQLAVDELRYYLFNPEFIR